MYSLVVIQGTAAVSPGGTVPCSGLHLLCAQTVQNNAKNELNTSSTDCIDMMTKWQTCFGHHAEQQAP
jgi:hypothetical protein